jgi:hypothetical protein
LDSGWFDFVIQDAPDAAQAEAVTLKMLIGGCFVRKT